MTLDNNRLSRWNEGISKAISEGGTADFPLSLQTALCALVDFDICMVFSYRQPQSVRSHYHNLPEEEAAITIEAYMKWPFILDPFYQATKAGVQRGFRTLREIAPDRFYQSEYYLKHYQRTGIRDEMGFFFPISSNETAVLSVTRQKNKKYFSRAEKARFATAEAIVFELGQKHWRSDAVESTTNALNAAGRNAIDAAFEAFGRGVLSDREREVVAYVLKGHSTASIALHLGISVGTVKNHRRNAYQRLGISSQAELFSDFVNALRDGLG